MSKFPGFVSLARSALVLLVCLLIVGASHSAVGATAALGKVAFVRDGDVWSLDLSSGTEAQLTHDGHAYRPQWSPSGAWLTYLTRGDDQSADMSVMRADGTAARRLAIPASSAPNLLSTAWSPLDDRLAYVDDSGDLVIVDADGSNHNVLVAHDRTNNKENLGSPLWSPDGSTLAYSRAVLPFSGEVWRIDADGGQASRLFQARSDEGPASPASWSADGATIYFWRSPVYSASIAADGIALWSIPANGGAPHDLGVTTLVYDDSVAPGPAGGLLVVDGGGRSDVDNKRVAVVTPDGTVSRLTQAQSSAISPALSPGGTTIALSGMPDVPGFDQGTVTPMAQRRIWLIDADGSNPRRLTADEDSGEERPLWSRDGRSILYVRPFLTFDRQQSRIEGSLRLYDLSSDSEQTVPVGMSLDVHLSYDGFYYSHVEWSYLYDWWQPR